MEGPSKLARQMAYKKKLEEEFRLEEERRKFVKKKKYCGIQLREGERRIWESKERRKRGNDTEELKVIEERKDKEEQERQERKENSKKLVEKSLKRKIEWKERTRRLRELKKAQMSLKQRERYEASHELLRDHDMLDKIESIIKENEDVMQRLEEYKSHLLLQQQLEYQESETQNDDSESTFFKENIAYIATSMEEYEMTNDTNDDLVIDGENEWLWGIGWSGADV